MFHPPGLGADRPVIDTLDFVKQLALDWIPQLCPAKCEAFALCVLRSAKDEWGKWWSFTQGNCHLAKLLPQLQSSSRYSGVQLYSGTVKKMLQHCESMTQTS